MSLRQLGILILPFVLLIVLGLYLLLGDNGRSGVATDSDPRGTQILSIATGTNSEIEMMDGFEPFLRFLNNRLKPIGVEIQPVVFRSGIELDNAMEKGKVDLFLESPFPVYTAVKNRGLRPIARQWKNGVENYHSVILAKRSSNLRTLQDLAGRTIAVEDCASSSSYSLPMSELMLAGFHPRELMDSSSLPGEQEIGYRFSQTDSVSIRWLLEGSVDAAAVSSVYFQGIANDIKGELAVVHETRQIPRYLLAVRPDLPEAIEQVVLDMLLSLETYPEGRKAMAALWNTKRFDLIPYENDLRERMFAMIELMSCEP